MPSLRLISRSGRPVCKFAAISRIKARAEATRAAPVSPAMIFQSNYRRRNSRNSEKKQDRKSCKLMPTVMVIRFENRSMFFSQFCSRLRLRDAIIIVITFSAQFILTPFASRWAYSSFKARKRRRWRSKDFFFLIASHFLSVYFRLINIFVGTGTHSRAMQMRNIETLLNGRIYLPPITSASHLLLSLCSPSSFAGSLWTGINKLQIKLSPIWLSWRRSTMECSYFEPVKGWNIIFGFACVMCAQYSGFACASRCNHS